MRIAISPRRRARALAVGAAVLAVGASALAAPAQAAPPERTAVIVQLVPGSDSAAEARRAAAAGGEVFHVYRNVFRGFAGEFSQGALEGLRRNPRVALIEADGLASASGVQTITDGGLWGLDRIDDVSAPDGSYTYAATGAGVSAYVVDTGVASHLDLDERRGGYDVFGTSKDGAYDCNGHGTHVAGTVAGNAHGVAKDATVVPVRVLDCNGSGSWSGVIAGLDWVAGNHAAGTPAVANMSLGGGRNSSVDAAVQRVIDDGVTVAVAAGNDGRDACNYSPARVAAALTVGATDKTDTRASWSNHGSCLDLFAPGVGVKSAWHTDEYSKDQSSTRTISGTSMATPHVAGAAALILSQANGASPMTVSDQVIAMSVKGEVLDPRRGSPNRLLQVQPDSTGTG